MRAGISPLTGQHARWTTVPAFTSDYIIEEPGTATRVRIVESVVDAGLYVNGSFRDDGVALSRVETSAAISLLLSKCLRRNLDGRSDIWLVPHHVLERTRVRISSSPGEWWPTSVIELHSEASKLSDEEIAFKTLHTFGLLEKHHSPPKVLCNFSDSHINLHRSSSGRIEPSGLVYGVDTMVLANEVINDLVNDGYLKVESDNGMRSLLCITREGSRLVKQQLSEGFELKALAREIESTNQHPVPDLSSILDDQRMAVVLARRWSEADTCHRVGAYFATAVVIGSILEGVLLDRIRVAVERGHEFKEIPDSKKISDVNDWGLANLLAVCANEGWIRSDRHRLGHVLRESRNLVHPANANSEEAEADERSARTYWEILLGVIEDLSRTRS